MLRKARKADGSYVVETDSEEVRRNKAHLRPLPDIQAPPPAVEDTEQAAGPEEGAGKRMQRAYPRREVKASEWLKDFVT